MMNMAEEKGAPPQVDESTDIRHVDEIASGEFPCLQVVVGPGRGNSYQLHPGKNLIGRNEIADIRLDDASISRDHAEIEVREEGGLVRDLDSRNGTWVQGEKIAQETPITHTQRLKVGIYDFQYLTEAAPLPSEEEAAGAPEEDQGEGQEGEQVAQATEGTEEISEEEAGPEEVSEEEAPPEVPAETAPPVPVETMPEKAAEAAPEAKPPLVRMLQTVGGLIGRVPRKVWFFGGGGLAVLIALAFGAHWVSDLLTGDGPAGPPEIPVETGIAPEPQAAPASIPVTVPEYVPVFLDFTSEPISALVYFGDEYIGTTPFRMSANLQYGRTYEVRATFPLKDVGEEMEERLRFALGADQQVIPLEFSAPIGTFKVKDIPRGVDLYLEGYFASDPHRAHPIKFNEVVFGKPFYLPYGHYIVELKQSRRLAASRTYVTEVAYRREFVLDQEQPQHEIEVKEADLAVFPATIRSTPDQAQLLIDGVNRGETPFEGELAIGSHDLIVRKEGYFEYSQPIDVNLNTPFEVAIELKTSQAGDLINEARVKMKQQRYKDSIHTLIDSLKKDPTRQEIAEAHYLIGQSYLHLGSYREARDYFVQAMRNDYYRYPARLGISQMYFAQGERIKALQVLVEVLIKAKRERVRSDAGRLFQKISPFKSVLFITTEPEGGVITVNDKQVGVHSPLILHDLLVGVYRIQVTKAGYQPVQRQVDLGVSEFKPIVIKLQAVSEEPSLSGTVVAPPDSAEGSGR